jgi:hypothetical protein
VSKSESGGNDDKTGGSSLVERKYGAGKAIDLVDWGWFCCYVHKRKEGSEGGEEEADQQHNDLVRHMEVSRRAQTEYTT